MGNGEDWLAKNRHPKERTAGDRILYVVVVLIGAAVVCALVLVAFNAIVNSLTV